MVSTLVKTSYFGFILAIIGVGIGSTFVPQLKREKRDFTIKSDDKRIIEMRPKSKHMEAISAAINSDKPWFGPKPRNS